MTEVDTTDGLFLSELKRRHIPVVARLEDGRYVITILGVECTVSIDNVRRNSARDGDLDAVSRFIDGLLATRTELPPWPEARAGLRFTAEPADSAFGDTVHTPITPALARVLACTDTDETRVSWLTPSRLESWGVAQAEAEASAAANMDTLLAQATLELEEIGSSHLGMFSIASVFKASLIFSPSLKRFVAPLGWPILIVAPCRDFLYAFTDRSLIPRLGAVVVREFNGSGYPVTTEVLEVSDLGVKALGAFGA